MTVGDLKRLYKRNNPGGMRFDRRAMRLFGDTMRNFAVYGAKVKTIRAEGIVEVEAWDLCRKRPVSGGLHGHYAFFRKDNGQELWGQEVKCSTRKRF